MKKIEPYDSQAEMAKINARYWYYQRRYYWYYMLCQVLKGDGPYFQRGATNLWQTFWLNLAFRFKHHETCSHNNSTKLSELWQRICPLCNATRILLRIVLLGRQY